MWSVLVLIVWVGFGYMWCDIKYFNIDIDITFTYLCRCPVWPVGNSLFQKVLLAATLIRISQPLIHSNFRLY